MTMAVYHDKPPTNSLDTRAIKVENDCPILSDYETKTKLDIWFPSLYADKANLMRFRFQFDVKLGSWFVNEKRITPLLLQE
ncbi:hypothetical protein MNAN1_003478 [Malassezia nana]|uniref:Uncharacterized protein n=1 Tax=Malassezia nana TaxID=180528 RepID=A0AAF0EL73_9BASI|nr:hypothetical protein MNAN1_003478 [Malassezia nana]